MRREPRQARSREMVERIVDAAHRVLAEEGYAALSTNRIAAAAGVSPGSLYQYFPDKQAVVDRLIERSWARIADEVAASLADRLGETGPGAVRGVVAALLVALEENAELLRVMTQDLPTTAHSDRMHALERRIRDLVGAYLVLRGTPDPLVPAWIVTIAVQSLATRFVLERPAGVERERFLDEMAVLWGGYLEPADPE